MFKLGQYCLCALLLAPLSGCFPFSALEVLWYAGHGAALVFAAVDEEGMIELAGYSLGPVSSGKSGNLVLGTPGAAVATPDYEGLAQWTGLANIRQSNVNQSIAAMTDTEIHFLWWHDERARYETLIRLPYSSLHLVDLDRSGHGASMRFCHEDTEILIADQAIEIDRNTYFDFLKTAYLVDRNKTEQAFAFLNQKIAPPVDAKAIQRKCNPAPEQEITGFGEDDLSGLD